jgi:hypothetical protein
MDIIYSDDEEDILERIYFLCDTSDTTAEEISDFDFEKILQSRIETSQEKTIPSIEENIIRNEVIGEKTIRLIKSAIKNKIPQKFIFYDNDDEIVNLKLFLSGMDPMVGLEYILKNYFKISVSNYMLIYYLSNKKQGKKFLIEKLNQLSSLSDKTFNDANFYEYEREVEIIVKENLSLLKEKLKKVEKFFSEINALPFSNQPEEIEKTLEMEDTRIEIFVRDGEFPFDIDNGEIVFDNLRTLRNVPLIIYNSFVNSFYKIEEGIDDIENFLDEEYKFEDKKENHIYLFIKILDRGEEKNQVVDLDLKNSKISFNYPGNTLFQVKALITKLIPDIVFIDHKKTSFNGLFEINFDNYSVLKVRYLTLFDSVFSNFLFLKENSRPLSLKKSTKYYFKTYEDNDSFSDHSVSFVLDKIFSNHYRVIFSSKIITKGIINEFILILSKLIEYYSRFDFNETFLQIVEERWSGPEGVGLGGEYIPDEDDQIKINSKKLDNLIRRAPGMFPKNDYSKFCPCTKQPIIIDQEDRKDWEKSGKNVVLFPPEDSKQRSKKFNFVCPENKYPHLYFMKNPVFGEKYPILPCCGITKNNAYVDDYEEIRKDDIGYWARRNKKRVRKEIRLKTVKILSTNQSGVLPSILSSFLRKMVGEKTKFIRRGVIKNNSSSFLHCLIFGSDHLNLYREKIDERNKEAIQKITTIINLREKYLSKTIHEREEIINIFREKISSFVNLASAYQECYNYTLEQIESFIVDKEKIFSSDLYYHLLENIFMVNIFVFRYENGEVSLEKPNHNFFHIREYNQHLPSIFIFKHISRKTIQSYELIELENRTPDTFPFIRGGDTLKNMKKYIQVKNYSLITSENGEDEIIKNAYDGVNWNIILKDYKILSQDIDSSGRLIKINISLGDGEKVSIFTKPSFPLNIKISKIIYTTKRKIATSLFGDDYVIGSEGLWYGLKHFRLGVFIPCQDIKESKNIEKQCQSYILIKNNVKINKDIVTIGIVKKNANILKQLILWLWNISDMDDVDEWFSVYTSVMEEKKLIELINITPIKIDYRFPPEIKTTESGIEYYSNYLPFIFNLNRIHLYKDLHESLLNYIKTYQKKLRGYPKTPNKSIINIFNTENDFKKYPNTKIIIGKDNYEQFFSGIKNMGDDIESIPDVSSAKREIFNYRSPNDGKYFLIQNTNSDRKEEAILGGIIWKKWKVNMGYDFSRTNAWKMMVKYPFLLELFSMTEEEIIEFSNSRTNIPSTTFEEATYYLSKERVAIPKDKFVKKVSVKYRSSDGIYEELIDSDEIVDVWEYGNGAYSIMLNF